MRLFSSFVLALRLCCLGLCLWPMIYSTGVVPTYTHDSCYYTIRSQALVVRFLQWEKGLAKKENLVYNTTQML